MIIDKLILHDFGVYGGYQEIELTPASLGAPVVLFGGLNGAGKTTLLDALQLCLFGPVAKCSNRNGQGYPEYLAGCINKHARNKEALIGLDFRRTSNGKESSYRIRRSWRKTGKSVAEEFKVHIDAMPAKTVTNNWLHHVEEIMPANIAHLFFFDGEQAEGYVTAENANVLIETAILNLLGLDIVNQLDKDLKTLERRKTIKDLNAAKRVETAHIEKMVGELQEEIEHLHQRSAWLRTYEIVPKQNCLAKLESQFRKIGGDLYERKAEIEATAKGFQEELASCEEVLRNLAGGCLPFALVHGLLASLGSRDQNERVIAEAETTLNSLVIIKEQLLPFLRKKRADAIAQAMVESYLDEQIRQGEKAVGGVVANPMDEHTRLAFLSLYREKLPQAIAEAKELLSCHHVLKQKAEDAVLEWAGVPKIGDVADILEEREEVQKALAVSENELNEITLRIEATQKQMGQHEAKLQSLLAEAADQQIKEEEKARILTHSAKARETLSVFRDQVVRGHIRHIEALVLDNYQNLLRKESLISRIIIDPETFQLHLHDRDDHRIPTDRLSAGERQLLAISMLWGMAKASGRPLPAAIDTPLGRLDATHRRHLIQRYFPCASHQVLLFSTDQEVSGEYFDDLKDKVGRSYRLEYDDQTGTTKVVEGYLA